MAVVVRSVQRFGSFVTEPTRVGGGGNAEKTASALGSCGPRCGPEVIPARLAWNSAQVRVLARQPFWAHSSSTQCIDNQGCAGRMTPPVRTKISHETHVSTIETATQASLWIPEAQQNQGRSLGIEQSSPCRTEAPHAGLSGPMRFGCMTATHFCPTSICVAAPIFAVSTIPGGAVRASCWSSMPCRARRVAGKLAS